MVQIYYSTANGASYYVVQDNGNTRSYRVDAVPGMNGEITGKIARLQQQLRDLEQIAEFRRQRGCVSAA